MQIEIAVSAGGRLLTLSAQANLLALRDPGRNLDVERLGFLPTAVGLAQIQRLLRPVVGVGEADLDPYFLVTSASASAVRAKTRTAAPKPPPPENERSP